MTELSEEVRLHVFREAAATTRIPQPPEIATTLGRSETQVREALGELAASRVIVLAPNSGNIWIAAPFCAVPSPFQVHARGKVYYGICIWDALGILAILGSNGSVHATCGDCGDPLRLDVAAGTLVRAEGVIHFAVPALRWWDNIGFT